MNFRTKHLEHLGGWEHGRSVQKSSPRSALAGWVASPLCLVSVLSSAGEGAPGRLCLPCGSGRWEFRGRACIVAAEAYVAHRRRSIIDGPVLDWLGCSSDSRGWHVLPLSPRSCLALSWVSGPAS